MIIARIRFVRARSLHALAHRKQLPVKYPATMARPSVRSKHAEPFSIDPVAAALQPPSLLQRLLRGPVDPERGAEQESAWIRLGLLSLALLFTVIATRSLISPAAVLSLVALVCAGLIQRHIQQHPDPSTIRRVLAILLDQGYCSALLLSLGEPAAVVLVAILTAPVGSAFRFGPSYGAFSGAMGMLGIAALLVLCPYLRGLGMVGVALLLACGAISGYAVLLARRIQRSGKAERRRARMLARAAKRDALTGLANRAHFTHLLGEALTRGKHSINPTDSFAVLYCDLDGFKAVNDTHGHDVGDILLKQVADTLGMCVRSTDVAARLGGDEFAVLLSSLGDANIARRIGEDIVSRVQSINTIDGRAIKISCSVGITMARVPLAKHHSTESLLKSGDEAMYEAKRSGKNRCHFQMAA